MTKIPIVVSRIRRNKAIEIKASEGGEEARRWISFSDTSKFFVNMKMFLYLCENDEELHAASADANRPETAKEAPYSLFLRKGWQQGADDKKWENLAKFIEHEADRGKPLKTKEVTEFLENE
jgi:hypothetical protein